MSKNNEEIRQRNSPPRVLKTRSFWRSLKRDEERERGCKVDGGGERVVAKLPHHTKKKKVEKTSLEKRKSPPSELIKAYGSLPLVEGENLNGMELI